MASHKRRGMILDSNVSYENSIILSFIQIQSVFSGVNKTIGLFRKFQPTLARKSLVKIYKLFIRPHLDCGDVIYDRASNESFHQSLESLQYSAAIAITRTTRGASSEKLLQDLDLETIKSTRWLRKLCFFIN